MFRQSQLATIALGMVIAACRKQPSEVPDDAVYVKIRLDPLPSIGLAAARSKPSFSALACDGVNVHGVSGVGVTLTERVPGRVPKDSNLHLLAGAPSLAAVAVSGGSGSVVTVGARGAIFRRTSGGGDHLNDETDWTPEVSPAKTDLHAVAIGTNWTVAVGARGTIVAQLQEPGDGRPQSAGHRAPWISVRSPTQEDLFAVSRCDLGTQKVCVVGARGTLLVGDATPSGFEFRSMTTGTERTLRGLTPGDTIASPHAVGDQGTIIAINANGGEVVPSGTTEDLLAVAEGVFARRFLDASSIPVGGGEVARAFVALVAVGKHGAVVVQARGGYRDKVAPFEQLPALTTEDLVAIVPDHALRFLVAPRAGGLSAIALNIDCSRGWNRMWCGERR